MTRITAVRLTYWTRRGKRAFKVTKLGYALQFAHQAEAAGATEIVITAPDKHGKWTKPLDWRKLPVPVMPGSRRPV